MVESWVTNLGSFARILRTRSNNSRPKWGVLSGAIDIPTTAQSEGIAVLRMEVADLKVKWIRLNESHQNTRTSIDSIPVLRDATCSLDSKAKDLIAQAPTEVLWEVASERVAEATALKSDISELKSQVLKLTDSYREIQLANGNIAVSRDAIGCHLCTSSDWSLMGRSVWESCLWSR